VTRCRCKSQQPSAGRVCRRGNVKQSPGFVALVALGCLSTDARHSCTCIHEQHSVPFPLHDFLPFPQCSTFFGSHNVTPRSVSGEIGTVGFRLSCSIRKVSFATRDSIEAGFCKTLGYHGLPRLGYHGLPRLGYHGLPRLWGPKVRRLRVAVPGQRVHCSPPVHAAKTSP
jgi:hypothetical protein